MTRDISPEAARAAIRTRAQLERGGWRPRDLERAVGKGEIRRIQRNRYVTQPLWQELWPESRHLLEVLAAHAEMRDGEAVASYDSAGVLFGLPFYRHEFRQVHVTIPEGARSSSRSRLMRHREPLPAADVTVQSGVPCTTLERTVFDVIRSVSREAAVAFADAALRTVAWTEDRYDAPAAAAWRERMLDRIDAAPGTRGIRQAREVVAFADGRAELPGESVSRLQLFRLGFTRFDLQVPVSRPDGEDYRVDLEILEARTLYEFDGKGKYLDEALRSGRPLDRVLLAEKRREDWIRGKTQKPLIRAEDAHIASPEALAKRLAAFGIRLP